MIVEAKRSWSRQGRFRRVLPVVVVSMLMAGHAIAATHDRTHHRDPAAPNERGRVLALKGGGTKRDGGKGEAVKTVADRSVAARGGGQKVALAGSRRPRLQLASLRTGMRRGEHDTEADFAAELAAGDSGGRSEPGAYAAAEDGHQTGLASWYGGKAWNGHRTSDGGQFSDVELTAAHATLPLGSMVRVTLASSERSVVVRINDRPGTRRRIIDLSRAAAERLGMLGAGVAVVTLNPL